MSENVVYILHTPSIPSRGLLVSLQVGSSACDHSGSFLLSTPAAEAAEERGGLRWLCS